MNYREKQGYDWTKGALRCIAVYFLIGLALSLAWNLVQEVDDSDQSRWHRSGLKVHTDAKTGVQYLSDGKGGLIRR
jgi:hypothetical protein